MANSSSRFMGYLLCEIRHSDYRSKGLQLIPYAAMKPKCWD